MFSALSCRRRSHQGRPGGQRRRKEHCGNGTQSSKVQGPERFRSSEVAITGRHRQQCTSAAGSGKRKTLLQPTQTLQVNNFQLANHEVISLQLNIPVTFPLMELFIILC